MITFINLHIEHSKVKGSSSARAVELDHLSTLLYRELRCRYKNLLTTQNIRSFQDVFKRTAMFFQTCLSDQWSLAKIPTNIVINNKCVKSLFVCTYKCHCDNRFRCCNNGLKSYKGWGTSVAPVMYACIWRLILVSLEASHRFWLWKPLHLCHFLLFDPVVLTRYNKSIKYWFFEKEINIRWLAKRKLLHWHMT